MYASCAMLWASSSVNPIAGIAACCARAASGHATAAPPMRGMNSRRLTRSPRRRIRHTPPVAEQASGPYIRARGIDCGTSRARRQRDDLHVTAGEERVGRDHKRVGLIASERGKSDLYLTAIPRVRDLELDTEGGSRCSKIFDEVLGRRGVRIYQCTNTSRSGKKLAQQAQSLCHQFAHERVHAGGVAARPTETGDETEFDRVVSDVEDDGSPAARGDRRARCIFIGSGDDNRHLSSYEISSQQGETVVLSLSIAILDCYVLVFDIARFGQGPEKCREIRRHWSWRSGMKKSDHWHRGLLRARREWPRDRAAECDHQFPPSDGDCHAPSRARVRKRNIPRHERAVPTARHPARTGARRAQASTDRRWATLPLIFKGCLFCPRKRAGSKHQITSASCPITDSCTATKE